LVVAVAAGPLGLRLGGHVLGDLGVPDQLPLVEQGGVGPRGVEGAAFLAAPPAAPLEASLGGGPGQHLLRQPGRDVVRLVEPAELLAEDLLGRPALDPFRARVPADHPTLGVEQEDGVVLDRLDQQAELLVAGHAGLGALLPALHDGHAAPTAATVSIEPPDTLAFGRCVRPTGPATTPTGRPGSTGRPAASRCGSWSPAPPGCGGWARGPPSTTSPTPTSCSAWTGCPPTWSWTTPRAPSPARAPCATGGWPGPWPPRGWPWATWRRCPTSRSRAPWPPAPTARATPRQPGHRGRRPGAGHRLRRDPDRLQGRSRLRRAGPRAGGARG